MADLVRVRDKRGKESVVGSRWLTRWPEDFTPVGEDKKTTRVVGTDSPTGEKKKEK